MQNKVHLRRMLPNHNIQHNIGVFKGVGKLRHIHMAVQMVSTQLQSRNYVDGVSLTHGSKNQHIWTFAATDIGCI